MPAVYPADAPVTLTDDQGAYYPADAAVTLTDEHGAYYPADAQVDLVESSRSIKRAGLEDQMTELRARAAELDKQIPPRKEDPLVPVDQAWDQLFARKTAPASPLEPIAEQQDRARIGVAHTPVTLGDTSAKPLVKLGRMNVTEDDSTAGKVMKSAVNAINEGVESFTSQQGVEAMLMAGPVARFAFATLGAIGATRAAALAATAKSPEEFGTGLGGMILNGAQVALLTRGGKRAPGKAEPGETPPAKPGEPPTAAPTEPLAPDAEVWADRIIAQAQAKAGPPAEATRVAGLDPTKTPVAESAGQSETITGPAEPGPAKTGRTAATDALQGAEIPADPGVSPGPAAPTNRPQRKVTTLTGVDRPYDIIDAIQDHMGGRLSLTYARKIREDFRPASHVVRKLFARTGYTLDVALDGLHREGQYRNIETEDQFLDAIEAVPAQRAEFRDQKSAAEKQHTLEKAQKVDFERIAIRNLRVGDEAKASDAIAVDQFYPGDEFKLSGTKFKVTNLEFDEETGQLLSLQVEDGQRFGVQTLNGKEVIHADKGSIKQTEPDVDFGPSALENAEAWADGVIKESPKKLNIGLDPQLFIAAVVKGSAVLARGIREFAAWSKEVLSRFGPELGAKIRPYLGRIYEESKRRHESIDLANRLSKLPTDANRPGTEVTQPSQFASFDLQGNRSGSISYLDDKYSAKPAAPPEYYALSESYAKQGYDRALALSAQRGRAPRSQAGPGTISRYPSHRAFLARIRRADEIWRQMQSGGEAWADGVIKEAKKRLYAGLDPELFAAYTVKGAAILSRGIRDFAKWSTEMTKQFGPDIRPHLQKIYDEAKLGLAKVNSDEAKLKLRKLAQRGAVSPEVTPEQQERFRTSASSYYEPQSDPDVREAVKSMPSDQLAAVPVLQSDGPNNVWVAAQMELYRRLIAAGQPDAAWGVMENAMKTGTSLGQLVNQFKHLAGATPEGVMIALNRRLVSQGFDPLRPSEVLRLRVLAEGSIAANARWHALEQAYRGAPTEANFADVSRARMHAITADVAMQDIIRQYHPKSFWDTIGSLLQGNLLAPISFIANFSGNTINLPWRAGKRTVQAVVSAIDAAVTGNPRVATIAPLRATSQAAQAVARSLPDAWRVLYHGASDFELAKTDSRGQMKPIRALRDLLLGEYSGPTKGGKMPLGIRLALVAEASPFGMHATAALRILAATDLPSREGARARIITHAMELRRLNNGRRAKELAGKATRTLDENAEMEALRASITNTSETAKAVKYPELFFSEKELSVIREQTLKAVYQNQNAASRAVFGAINRASPFVRFLFRTVAPYVTTPTNWISEILSWQPVIASGMMAKALKEGNRAAAGDAAGRLLLGSLMTGAAIWMYKKGVLSPSLDDPDEAQKARMLSEEYFTPNTINITGLDRALRGEDGNWQAGDRLIDVMRGGGIAGALLMNAANILRRVENQPETPGKVELGGQMLRDEIMLTLGYAVNQTFLRGTSDFLNAIKEGTPDAWFKTWAETILSIPLPNTLTAASRAMRENKPELRGDSMDKTLENIVRNRLGFTGADKDLPYRRDLWGRPIPETPEGALPWIHQMFDISKTRTIPADTLAGNLYTLYRRTADERVIPTPPGKSMVVLNTRYDLTREQQSRLQELTGQARRTLGDRLVAGNINWQSAPDEAKIRVLEALWSRAAQLAKLQFLVERGSELKAKGKPVGFEPAR